MRADHITPPDPPGQPRARGFGGALRQAREARGVTLETLAEATRISRRHLEALERSDLDALPAGPFAKGYIQACAKVLGIDPEPMLASYRLREKRRGLGTAEGERKMLDELSQLLERRAGKKRPAALPLGTGYLALAVLVLATLAVVGWGLARARRPGPPAARAPAASVRESPKGPSQGPAPTPPERPSAAVAAGSPAPTHRVVAPTETLEVTDHGVGSDLADHRLVGQSDRFPEGATVVFWNLVRGGRPGHVIRHVWFQDGRAVMKAALPIGGPSWRTYSRLLLPRGSPGRWSVEARTSDGRLLARDEFLCESARP